jgi:hypothetical protein
MDGERTPPLFTILIPVGTPFTYSQTPHLLFSPSIFYRYDPAIQYAAYYNYTVHPGNTFDYSPFNKTVQHEMYNNLYGPGNCIDQINLCTSTGRNDVCSIADSFCANYVEGVFDVVTGRDECEWADKKNRRERRMEKPLY